MARLLRHIIVLCIVLGSLLPLSAQRQAELERPTLLRQDLPQGPQGALAANPPAINFTRKPLFVPTTPGGSAFARPTGLTFGPDGRLYVAQLDGRIFALTLDEAYDVTAVEQIDRIYQYPNRNDDGSPAIGVIGRQLIGIVFDPDAPPSAPVLYVTHSDPRIGFNSSTGAEDIDTHSGVLTRLTGPNFASGPMEHLITGLPRSRENHSTNSIVWGPDGWLYIAQAGNTNNGAPSFTFSNLPEMYLAAAILRANVKDPAFVPIDTAAIDEAADMAPYAGLFELYATGYRNAYDLIWHSNGNLYLNDNGGNPGFGNTPGAAICPGGAEITPPFLNDHLNMVTPGSYGGHPNPARGECVLDNGQLYSPTLQPLPNYVEPLAYYYGGASTNGIAEYTAPTFGGAMVGDLIAATYASDQNVRRVKLTPDGSGVASISTLGAFVQPLDVITNDDGVIFVAEHGGDAITALLPNPPLIGAWAAQPPLPAPRSEVAVAEVGDLIYVIGGLDEAGQRVGTVEIYNPYLQTWSTGPTLPGPARDHIGAAVISDTLYVVGGLTGWPGPAVADVYALEPEATDWEPRASLPVARGAMGVAALDGKLYAVGGLRESSPGSGTYTAVADVTIYDPVADSWTAGAPLGTARDHLTLQALDGALYAIGGRALDIGSALPTNEIYDPTSDSWSYGAPMPTPRGGHASAVLGERIIVFGGEGPSGQTGGVYEQTEEFNPANGTWRTLAAMPTPRHGIGGVAVSDVIFVPGGAPTQGASATSVHEAFTFTDFTIGGACPIPDSDPGVTDSDGDGFTDADEQANGTDICNQASLPADFDGDLISDLLDPDDDNDTIPDSGDQLYFDAQNGATTQLPLRFNWNPGDAPLGKVSNSGFTGVQITNAGTRHEPTNISVGGAGGFLSLTATSGTSRGPTNTQENALQLGFDARRPFRVETRITQPFLGQEPEGSQAGGLFIGIDQDTYVKLMATADKGDGEPGLEFAVETSGVYRANASGGNLDVPLPGVGNLDLRLDGDPATLAITASYQLDGGGWAVLGVVSGHEYPVLTRMFRPGLAAGLMATAADTFPPKAISFVYDYFSLGYTGLAPIVRVNAGGPTVTLSGTTWVSDTTFLVPGATGGTYTIDPPDAEILNTDDDELYRTERYGGSSSVGLVRYIVPVPEPGLYTVDLHFAEIFYGVVPGENGRRSFDIELEGATVLRNYDVSARAAGSRRAHIESFTIPITDGELSITINAQTATSVDNGKLSAFAVYRIPEATLVPQGVLLPFVQR